MERQNVTVIFDRVAIKFKSRSSWLIFKYCDIVSIQRDRDCAMSKIVMSDGEAHHIDVSLKTLSNNLPVVFFRYGRFGIVNLIFLQAQVTDNKRMKLILKDGTEHFVSRELHDDFHDKIKKIDLSYPCEMCQICYRSSLCEQAINFSKRDTTFF